ncbi:MAG: aldehyde:ferredoxin oxidoreductase, partial [Chloroflexi bacterium]|nr:aldehyde:ferredoxin oxidoreductase [Chloroflexota bacterium]
RILRENETGVGLRTNLRIGGGGENLVSYACVSTEMYRHFGRLGLGAVFGSKKLKAIIIAGRGSIPVVDPRLYREIYDEIYKKAVDSPVMKKYHDLGTAENVNPLNKLGGLPTRNLKESKFEHADEISGESYAKNYLGRRLACSHCPISCIHVAALREPYANDPYFYKTSMIGYDYEPIFSLGTMLGISDPQGLLKLMEVVEEYTVDAMSVGVVLAWATEAQEKDIISYKETQGLKFTWGDYETYIRAIRLISSEQPNDFYKALARGVEYAATKYGGLDFAMSFAKNEMAGYHTGPGAYIGLLIGARHSHLDNAGYSMDQKMQADNILSPEKLVDGLIKEECWRQILSDLVVCFFARGIYQPDTVLKALTLAGFNLTLKDLDRIGEEVFIEKYKFKLREGFTFDNMRLPMRMFETPAPIKFDENYIRQALEYARKTIMGKVNRV